MTTDGSETPANPAAIPGRSRRGPGGRQPGAGRKPTHGARILRKTLGALTTNRLDGRSALAVAVRHFKEDCCETVPRRAMPSVAVLSNHEPPRTARTNWLPLLLSPCTPPPPKRTNHANVGPGGSPGRAWPATEVDDQ